MTDESKVLTANIAEQFLADAESIDLTKFTEIEDAAAEALSRHEGRLSLNGLTTLSDAAAEALSRHEGWWLQLDGLTTLSKAAAEALSRHQGELFLDGLTTLSDANAEALSQHKGDYLSLSGLTTLPDAAAESLSRHKGDLGLNGLTTLSDAAAESLVRNQCEVGLEGLKSFSNSPEHLALVEFLCRCNQSLWLYGLTELSDEAAEIFSRHRGELDLTGLRKLSTNAYRSLAKRPGGLYWNFDGISGVLFVFTNFLRSRFR